MIIMSLISWNPLSFGKFFSVFWIKGSFWGDGKADASVDHRTYSSATICMSNPMWLGCKSAFLSAIAWFSRLDCWARGAISNSVCFQPKITYQQTQRTRCNGTTLSASNNVAADSLSGFTVYPRTKKGSIGAIDRHSASICNRGACLEGVLRWPQDTFAFFSS